MAFSLALYLALPFMQITCTPLVFRGVGMRTWDEQQLITDQSFKQDLLKTNHKQDVELTSIF